MKKEFIGVVSESFSDYSFARVKEEETDETGMIIVYRIPFKAEVGEKVRIIYELIEGGNQ
jgi:hypothetical protein